MTASLLNKINAANPHECVWMQAGIVRRKYCTIDYQCPACRYDRLLQRTADENQRLKAQGIPLRGKRGRIVSWRDKLKEQPPSKRPCLHHMKGRIEFRTCTNDYRCSDCDFDQFFYDQFSVYATVAPVGLIEVEGFRIPHGFYLHPGHAWIKIEEDNTVRIGVDEFVLRLLGPIDRIEAPLIGKTLNQGAPDIVLRHKEKTARLISPVSGVVTAANIEHLDGEKIASHEAYSNGWIVRAHSTDLRRDLKKLMIGEETSGFLASEIRRLLAVIEAETGPMTTDGGNLGDDLYGKLPQLGWQRLTRMFLRSG